MEGIDRKLRVWPLLKGEDDERLQPFLSRSEPNYLFKCSYGDGGVILR
jgi:hypothetical protein